MWIEAGFQPDEFWHQSPQTFQHIMSGVRKRLDGMFEREMSVAWHTAAFTAASQSKGGLKPLRDYMRKPQTPAQMLAALRAMGRKSDMTIKRMKEA